MKEITMPELKDMLVSEDSALVMLDVRNPDELVSELKALEGVINIPVQDLEERIEELDTLKNETIYVICRAGIRSRNAAMILKSHGFDAVNVKGGMIAYYEN